MFPKGTIYKSGKSKRGEVKLALSRAARLSYSLLRGLGAGLVAFVVVFLLFTLGPVLEQELAYNFGKTGADEEKVLVDTRSFVDTSQAERILEVQEEARSYGVDSYFSVVVPKIDAASNIIANVDASDSEEYLEALQQGVAHAGGTYFPGQGEKIFLFAHSTDSPINITRYNAVFYLLRKLEEEDIIIVYFADKKYIYKVVDKFTAESEDVSWLEDDNEGERLYLMTCDPPGTTWKRLLVVAEPK